MPKKKISKAKAKAKTPKIVSPPSDAELQLYWAFWGLLNESLDEDEDALSKKFAEHLGMEVDRVNDVCHRVDAYKQWMESNIREEVMGLGTDCHVVSAIYEPTQDSINIKLDATEATGSKRRVFTNDAVTLIKQVFPNYPIVMSASIWAMNGKRKMASMSMTREAFEKIRAKRIDMLKRLPQAHRVLRITWL